MVSADTKNKEIVTLSNEIKNEKTAPETTDERISGKVTSQNVRVGLAPKIAAAFSKLSSKVAMPVNTKRMTYGIVINTCANKRPVNEPANPR
jgi:hypothetical protein